tara:strand:- start:181 stop:354 length:174 start_codon:yes stop_codon:yes gene_type:complete
MNTLTVKLTEEEIHTIKHALKKGNLKEDFISFIKMFDDAKQEEQDKLYGESCKDCDI